MQYCIDIFFDIAIVHINCDMFAPISLYYNPKVLQDDNGCMSLLHCILHINNDSTNFLATLSNHATLSKVTLPMISVCVKHIIKVPCI